jgi:hypothetical protein
MRSTADILSSVLECIRPDELRSTAQNGGRKGWPSGSRLQLCPPGREKSWPSSDRLLQVDAWAVAVARDGEEDASASLRRMRAWAAGGRWREVPGTSSSGRAAGRPVVLGQ